MDIHSFGRIALVGNNGSGKSFFARRLAAATGLPLTHLDTEYWRPGWEALPEREWEARQRELVAGEKWILDGNHSGTMELRFQRAELVIFLDRNRLACLAGVIKRYGKPRPDLPPYLKDRLDGRFLQMLKGLWLFPKSRRPAILALHKRYPHVTLCVIKSKGGMARLLAAPLPPRGI